MARSRTTQWAGERKVRGGRGHRGASYVEKRGRCLKEEEHRPGGKRKKQNKNQNKETKIK